MNDFQARVDDWMQECFGPDISADGVERNHRFLEEALELVQALGCTASEARQLVDYVYDRPEGEPAQEVGGVRVTLSALCTAHGINEDDAAEQELQRIWTKVAQIRAKQAAKPKHSPLPEASVTKDELIAKQQLEIEGLKVRLAAYEHAERHVESICHCIGGPLNDNKLQFNRQQRAVFHRILEQFTQVPEASS